MADGKAGAPKGNDNAKRGTEVRQALRRAICKVGMKVTEEEFEEGLTNYQKGLEALAAGFLPGDKDALAVFREVADRMDGKPVQQIAAEVKTESRLIIRD